MDMVLLFLLVGCIAAFLAGSRCIEAVQSLFGSDVCSQSTSYSSRYDEIAYTPHSSIIYFHNFS